ncbi:hypothetical protein [Micromonospora sp. NBC_01813]|uniref:hypothetical protein n=1 Tax=Micromonospora sp. NBC_01813 TaxID=2975988 RepID=UPI002DDC2EBF|nr:hypothetical protein [Micromonospora sp. NBC_01813]WSA08600.1 hypothetical protein OG958_31225 [Micromonospora sp. NBC_01813]
MPKPLLSGRVIATAATIPTATPIAITTAIVAAIVAAPLLTTATPAYADTTTSGAAGQRLTVSKSTGISRSGETVSVSGTGYDTSKGIYVAFCVDNGAGAAPSPCGGGVDTSGTGGSSHWISSNPPSYGEGLAVPYGTGGSFQVSIPLVTKIGDVDCTVRTCSVVTRADHTRTSDRSQDVRVPITFAAAAPAPAATSAAPAAGTPARPTAPAQTGGGTTGTTGGTDDPTAGTTAESPTGASTAPDATTGADPAGAGTADSTDTEADGLSVTRVSTVGPAGQWWSSTLILLALGILALLGLSAARRRTRRSTS